MNHEDLHHTTEKSSNGERQLPRVAILLTPAMREQMLTPAAQNQLATIASVVVPKGSTLQANDVPELLHDAVACLTGWGTPPLSDKLLASLPLLRLVAHTAGSIRHLISLAAIKQGVHVSHAAAIIADSVAEFVISQALLCLRNLHDLDRRMKEGHAWNDLSGEYPGRMLGSRTVGVIGTGRVGRAVIRLFKAFGCQIRAYDPYLTTEQATQMGVEATELEKLLTQAEIVTLHAPVLPETRGMMGAAQLARLRDHAILINAARAALVDEEALYQEVKRGRIMAALDVFDEEPLPCESRWRSLSHVILSPHTAGHTIDTHLRQGQAMVDEITRFLSGEPLHYEVTTSLYEQFA